MRSKRVVLVVGLCALAFLVGGCEVFRWLRLLSFKKQLGDLDRYVKVDDQDGLSLRFRKPVVYCDDLSLLIENETLRTTNQNRINWLWTYEKQSVTGSPPPGDFDMTFTMYFENLKLTELRFPERFLALMPKPLITGLLRSLGQAEIDTKRGTVKAKWVGPGGDQKVELPPRSRITALLGEPFLVTETNRQQTLLYKYYQKISIPCPPAERLAWARFTFPADSEEMISSEGIIGNVGWRMTRVPDQPELRISFSLVPMSVEPVALPLPAEITGSYVGQYKEPGGTVVNFGHDGGTYVASWTRPGSAAWYVVVPELTNVFLGAPEGAAHYRFLRDQSGAVTGLVANVQGADTTFAKFANQLPPCPEPVRIDPAALAACVGRYKPSWGGLVILSCTGDQLYWQNWGIRARIPLYPASETNFFFKSVMSPLTFVKGDKGQVTKFILRFNGGNSEAEKLK